MATAAPLTPQQIKFFASRTWSGNDLNIAVAVALAESGGKPTAHANAANGNPRDDSYGLWQINMIGSLGPDRRRKFGITRNEELYDPTVNAKAATIIYKESGWKAWTTYTSGKYKDFMTAAGAAPSTNNAGLTLAEETDPNRTRNDVASDDPFANIPGAITAVGNNIFKGISNTVGILVAITLLVLGVVLLARNVIPMGKVATVAKKVLS